ILHVEGVAAVGGRRLRRRSFRNLCRRGTREQERHAEQQVGKGYTHQGDIHPAEGVHCSERVRATGWPLRSTVIRTEPAEASFAIICWPWAIESIGCPSTRVTRSPG